MSYVSIAGLDKAEVLAALFNGSQQQGMGFLQANGRLEMTIADAREVLRERGSAMYFDYLRGRVMKIDIGEEPMFTALYNRDNGAGSAERIIERLRQSSAPAVSETPRYTERNPDAAWPFPTEHRTFDAATPEPERAPAMVAGGGGDFGGGGADASYEAPAPSPSYSSASESCSASSYSDSSSSSSSSDSSSSSSSSD